MRRHLHVYRRVYRGWSEQPRAECVECGRVERLENVVMTTSETLEALRKARTPR